MSGVFEFFEKIQKQILDLQNTVHQFQQSWEKFQKFWDLFFTIVPWEVLLLLLFSVILLSLFNSVSPTTPRVNLSVAVILMGGLWAYFWGIFSDTVQYGTIIRAILYILVPLHLVGLATLGYKLIRSWHLAKKRIHPRSWEEGLNQISRDYNQLMALAFEKSQVLRENESEIEARMLDLEKSVGGLRSLFPK